MNRLAFRHTAALLIIGLMFFSGLPFFAPEDADLDGKIGLSDAVLRLQTLENVGARVPVKHTDTDIEACQNILNTLAGIKKIAPPAFSAKKWFPADVSFLLPAVLIFITCFSTAMRMRPSVPVVSFITSPPCRPPIHSSSRISKIRHFHFVFWFFKSH